MVENNLHYFTLECHTMPSFSIQRELFIFLLFSITIGIVYDGRLPTS